MPFIATASIAARVQGDMRGYNPIICLFKILIVSLPLSPGFHSGLQKQIKNNGICRLNAR